MGSGKTTLGRILAPRLNMSFIDLDAFIEQRHFKTISQLFEEKGEDEFRKIEHNALLEVSCFENTVISTGGGAPCFFDNIDIMNANGLTVYLQLSPPQLVERLKAGRAKRPLIKNKNDEELLHFIDENLEKRKKFYEQAKLIVNTEEDVEEIVRQCRDALQCVSTTMTQQTNTDKYQNKYRIPTNRLQGYDYGATGCYFITICTKNGEHYFGEIINDEMQLSKIGEIAQSEWLKTTELRPDMNLWLDEFVVMPNHFHCIICIGDNQYNTHDYHGNAICRDALQCVSTTEPYKNKFGGQSKNLSSIIRGFKIAVTTYARKHNIDFAWQERFYDRIIRDNNGLNNVRTYIFNNPKNWNDDDYFT